MEKEQCLGAEIVILKESPPKLIIHISSPRALFYLKSCWDVCSGKWEAEVGRREV
jgi:hypothetical protein